MFYVVVNSSLEKRKGNVFCRVILKVASKMDLRTVVTLRAFPSGGVWRLNTGQGMYRKGGLIQYLLVNPNRSDVYCPLGSLSRNSFYLFE